MKKHHPLHQHHGLHAIAIRLTSEDISVGGPYFFCAILKHDKTPSSNYLSEEDFIWIKCKSTHTLQKLKGVYERTYNENIVFKLDNTFPDLTSTIQSLDSRGDRVIVLWAVSGAVSRPPTMDRRPLQPVNSQLMPGPPSPHAVRVKPEPGMDHTSTNENMMNRIPHSNSTTSGAFPENSLRADDGFPNYQQEQLPQMLREQPRRSTKEIASIIKAKWNGMTAGQRAQYSTATPSSPFAPGSEQSILAQRSTNGFHSASDLNSKVKREDNFSIPAEDDSFKDALEGQSRTSTAAEKSRLQKLLGTASPEVLEFEVQKGMDVLTKLAGPLNEEKELSEEAQQWLTQIENLQKQSMVTPTVIGVVGNTGAGKSSVINAMLDEERLVPTNCMRACTAVVTEMSFNSSENENEKYRASIEFIKAEDWEKELKLLFEEILDGHGSVSRECSNPETDAGVAYAKIKAVYPALTKEEMAQSTPEQLMRTPAVRDVLGTTKDIAHKHPDNFYQRLQHYVDSKEKNSGEKGSSGKSTRPSMEFWPLIKVVKIYTKSDALSTGAIIVDLPGVHDSNAARAAVAQNYIKQCTGLWIVAPINRAVDDKAAKSLLGESFKRQLKYDGTYSRVTFICSKTDDISLTEAADSLGIRDDMAELWAESDKLNSEKKELEQKVKDLKESKAVYAGVFEDADEKLETWEAIQSQFEKGETVYAPSDNSSQKKKRKHSGSPQKQRKKRKIDSDGSDDDFESAASAPGDSDADESDAEKSGGEGADESREPLTEEEIDSKISELKADKKKARQEKVVVEDKIKDVNKEIKEIKSKSVEIDAQMNSLCISGRNKYSKTAIQLDFAAGIKELDQENSLEEDEDNFNPDEEIRDYDEVARSLPVFCVSSRGYQKLCGRLKRDNKVNGFKTAEETEIPQLQAHCKKLTEKGRASNCRRFLNSYNQLTNSLVLWASNDGTGMDLTDEQKDAEARNLKKKLDSLEKEFEKGVENCIKELKESLQDNIYDKFDTILPKAINNAPIRFEKWSRPVNRYDRAAGGYHFMTFRALVRRNGVYTNAQGLHNWNEELCEPIMKDLGNSWEKVFVRRLPLILNGFTRQAKTLLGKFHSKIEKRCLERGIGIAGMTMLKQQLGTYDTEFRELVQAVNEVTTNLQREANRGFQPVIETEMQPSYEYCAGESGSGCYLRMKNQMRDHIEQNKTDMFQNSTDSVKELLKSMCRVIENSMANGADEAFIRIRRDYMQVVGGVKLPQGQIMSKSERVMRAAICKILEDSEKVKEEDSPMDENAADDQLQDDVREAADRIESKVNHGDDSSDDASSDDASSEAIADGEDNDESEHSNDVYTESHNDQEKDEDAMSEDEI